MFTIIGERINMSRKSIAERVARRDADYIARQVARQEAAGATHIDVNAGGDPAQEVVNMTWLAQVVAESTQLPLAYDSANAEALAAGLCVCNRAGTIINSITGEAARLASVLPLVSRHGTGVIALTMDDGGMPEDLDGRLRITRDLAARLAEEGIGPDRIYFDHLVRPAATNPGQAPLILEAAAAREAAF